MGSVLNNLYCCQRQEFLPSSENEELDSLMYLIGQSTINSREILDLSFENEPPDNESPYFYEPSFPSSSPSPSFSSSSRLWFYLDLIFGLPLATIVQKTGVPCDKTPGLIPAFLKDLFQFLRQEGLTFNQFRKINN